MTKRLVLLVIVLTAAATFACAEAGPKPVTHDPDADLAAVGAVRAAYAAAFKSGDAAGIAALFTSDGQTMESGLPTSSGPAGIEAAMKEAFGMMASRDITITPGKTEIAGDVVYETGMFKNSITMNTGGAAVTEEGRYLVVLRRQGDGGWKIAANMGNSPTMPPAAMPAK